jgi:hypothetical protein
MFKNDSLELPESYYGFVFITYFPNGKISVNQTTRFKHLKYFGSGRKVTDAIKHFKKVNLIKKIVKICRNQKQLDAWERIFIKQLDATNPLIGYNIEKGGKGRGRWSEQSKIKLSNSRKGKFKLSDERKAVLLKSSLDANLGIKRTTEHLKSLNDGYEKYLKNNNGHLKGINNPMYGKNHSEEMKKKIGLYHKGKILSDKTKKKMSASKKGKPKSIEHRLSLKNAWIKRKENGN